MSVTGKGLPICLCHPGLRDWGWGRRDPDPGGTPCTHPLGSFPLLDCSHSSLGCTPGDHEIEAVLGFIIKHAHSHTLTHASAHKTKLLKGTEDVV